MGSGREGERVLADFLYLLDKSQQLFASLRDLPQSASPKLWHPQFQKTFEVYTKLWRLQQQHRDLLEDPAVYGLKRWQVGEIASKIGQLYYHYYLRTSETTYLQESFVFYEAVRDRHYFADALAADTPDVAVKQLRFYARFLLVCLLSNRRHLARQLVAELTDHAAAFSTRYPGTPEVTEWTTVVRELQAFLDAERHVLPDVPDAMRVGRLASLPVDLPPIERACSLQQVVLVSNSDIHAIKFSELPLDLFRMLQVVERDMSGVSANARRSRSESTAAPNAIPDMEGKRTNPRKQLMYRPSWGAFFSTLANCYREVSNNGALLLYLSVGPGEDPNAPGLQLSVRAGEDQADERTVQQRNLLFPFDLVPFTRKPLFVIADAPNAPCMLSLDGSAFNQPVVVFAAPSGYPATLRNIPGGLFSMLLHDPLGALMATVHAMDERTEPYSQDQYIAGQSRTAALERTILTCVFDATSRGDFPVAMTSALADDFLRRIVCRFVLCCALHSHGPLRDLPQPRSNPPLPASLIMSEAIWADLSYVLEMLGGSHLFS